MFLKLPILKNVMASLINWAGELRKKDFVLANDEVWEDCDVDLVYPTGRTGLSVEESKVRKKRTVGETGFKCKVQFETPGPGAVDYIDLKLPFTPSKVDSHVAMVAIENITAGTYLAGFGMMSIAEDGDTLRIRYCDGTTFAAANVFCVRVRGDFQLN